MPTARFLVLPLATAALLLAGSSPAFARRSSESMPALVHYSIPAPLQVRAGTTAHVSRTPSSPGAHAKIRFVGHGDPFRGAANDRGARTIRTRFNDQLVGDRRPGNRHSDSRHSEGRLGESHRFDPRHFDNRHYGNDRDRDDFEEAKEHEGRHMHHGHGHGHGDSPGC